MKFYLDKKGLETVLLPWQAKVMRFVWETGETDSRTVHEHLQESEHAMSRASVIIFLNAMVDDGFLAFRETSCKGGWKRFYMPKHDARDEEAFKARVAERILAKLNSFAKEG